MFTEFRATPQEINSSLPSDEIIPSADLAVDSAFTVPAPPPEVWPWIVQLGKGRGGWYLPEAVERFTPQRWHGLRHINPALQGIAVGDTMGDWSGKDVELEVVQLEPCQVIAYRALYKSIAFSWAMTLAPAEETSTRIHSRTRLAPIKHPRLAGVVGGTLDRIVAAGLAGGLRQRLAQTALGTPGHQAPDA